MAKRGMQTTLRANMFSNVEFVMNLSKFIPSLVIQQLVKRETSKQSIQLPELQSMETVVVWADISGFTNLSEHCAKRGLQGNEDLAFCINRYMEGMVTNLNQYGGDIIKFVGDAMIVMWPPIDTGDQRCEEIKVETIRRAIQCAQDIQKQMNNLQILPGVSLSVKIGVGYGPCSILYVGGVFNRNENLTVGPALVDALKSEGMATGGGQVIVAHSCFAYVDAFFRSTELIDENGDKFHLINLKYQGQRVKVQSDAMKVRAMFPPEVLQKIQNTLKGCMAHCVIPYLLIEQEKFASEIRSLTVMFVSLGVDLSSATTEEGIAKIQQIVVAVQQQVYRLQGALNKLVMDDKGSTLICIWGLPPYAHADDASRALFTAFNMIEALKKIKGVYCNIGISSGECFSGIVGTSGSRKEFSVLGDIVNLAARIMGTLKGKQAKNVINCDLNTRMLASSDLEFTYAGHHELKGKSISIPFFQPVQPDSIQKMANQKVLRPAFFLQTHQNPMVLERSTDVGAKVKTVGFEEIMQDLVSDIAEYYSEDVSCSPYLAVVKGKIGQGKTAFLQHVIDELHSAHNFQSYLACHKDKLPVFASSISQESALVFMAGWRSIFQMMLVYHCKKYGKQKENFIGECIVRSNYTDKSNLICDVLSLNKRLMSGKLQQKLDKVPQVKPLVKPAQFVQLTDYAPSVKEDIVQFFTLLFKYLIDEGSEISDWGSEHKSANQSKHRAAKSKSSGCDSDSTDKPTRAPLIIVIDNASRLCPTSWQLLEQILAECEKIVILLSMTADSRDRFIVQDHSMAAFETVWAQVLADRSLQLRVIDLPSLSEENIGQLILNSAAKYRTTFTAEVKEMTKIKDPFDTIKDEVVSEEWRTSLIEKWQLHTVIKHIHDDVKSIITQKCQGNPLIALQYFVNMLQNGFVRVNYRGDVDPTEEFRVCQRLRDWAAVPVPRIALKINIQSTSNFINSVHQKGSQAKPGELENVMTAIVLLKVATVLGQDFTIEALKQIAPQPKTSVHKKRINEAIQLLENVNFFEIVDYCDVKGMELCRFNKMFLRETLYQMLKYKAIRKDLHTATENYFKINPNCCWAKDIHVRTDKLLQHMLLAQDVQDESQLLLERRKALTVLRVQNQISENPRSLILSQMLGKRPSTGKINKLKNLVQEVRHRVLVNLTPFELKWFHSRTDSINNNYIGSVKLQFVHKVEPLPRVHATTSEDQDWFPFSISVSMHFARNRQEAGRRDVEFVTASETERDKWISAIDYLKTKAIYDTYAKNNTLVNFLGQTQNQDDRNKDQTEVDISELLYDFGSQLQARTTHSTMLAAKQVKIGQTSMYGLQRSSSIFRRASQNPQNLDLSPLKAIDIVPKLKLLYKVAMQSFLNHLDTSKLRSDQVIAVSNENCRAIDVDLDTIQLPESSWPVEREIQIEISKIERASTLKRKETLSDDGSRQSLKHLMKSLGGGFAAIASDAADSRSDDPASASHSEDCNTSLNRQQANMDAVQRLRDSLLTGTPLPRKSDSSSKGSRRGNSLGGYVGSKQGGRRLSSFSAGQQPMRGIGNVFLIEEVKETMSDSESIGQKSMSSHAGASASGRSSEPPIHSMINNTGKRPCKSVLNQDSEHGITVGQDQAISRASYREPDLDRSQQDSTNLSGRDNQLGEAGSSGQDRQVYESVRNVAQPNSDEHQGAQDTENKQILDLLMQTQAQIKRMSQEQAKLQKDFHKQSKLLQNPQLLSALTQAPSAVEGALPQSHLIPSIKIKQLGEKSHRSGEAQHEPAQQPQPAQQEELKCPCGTDDLETVIKQINHEGKKGRKSLKRMQSEQYSQIISCQAISESSPQRYQLAAAQGLYQQLERSPISVPAPLSKLLSFPCSASPVAGASADKVGPHEGAAAPKYDANQEPNDAEYVESGSEADDSASISSHSIKILHNSKSNDQHRKSAIGAVYQGKYDKTNERK